MSCEIFWILTEHILIELLKIFFYPEIKMYQIAVTMPWVVTEVELFEFRQSIKNIPTKCLEVVLGQLD